MKVQMVTAALSAAVLLSGGRVPAASLGEVENWTFFGEELAERQSPAAVLRYFNEAVPPAEISARLLHLLSRDPVPPAFFPQYRMLMRRLQRTARDPWQEWTPAFWRTVTGALRYAALFDLLLADQTDSGAPLILLAVEGEPPLSSLVPFIGGKPRPVFAFRPGTPVVFTVAALPKRPLEEVKVTPGTLLAEDSDRPIPAKITITQFDHLPLLGTVPPQLVPVRFPDQPQPLMNGYRLYRVDVAPFPLPQTLPQLPLTGRIKFELPQESRTEELIYQLRPECQ